jgi:quercetin dioxygenase-like cupin family protein
MQIPRTNLLASQEAVMLGKRTALVGLVATALVVSAVDVASADAGSGFNSVVIAKGLTRHSFDIHQRKGNDVVTAQNTLEPGGSSGWHSHPGTTLVVIQSGQFILYSEPVGGGRCRSHTYTAGQVYLEQPGDEQNAVNNGTVTAVAAVTFFNVPHGASPRIDRANPGDCPR